LTTPIPPEILHAQANCRIAKNHEVTRIVAGDPHAAERFARYVRACEPLKRSDGAMLTDQEEISNVKYADLEVRILEKETNGCSVEINFNGELEFLSLDLPVLAAGAASGRRSAHQFMTDLMGHMREPPNG
jgi:hypothetical protein